MMGVFGTSDVEVYNPGDTTWHMVENVNGSDADQAATLLPDGRVLLTGGIVNGIGASTNLTEMYDPATDHWADGPPMCGEHADHTVTLLPDGTVLIAGGGTPSVEHYASAGSIFAQMSMYLPLMSQQR